MQIVLKELYEGMIKGHFATNITAKKNLDACYWWPTIFKNINEFCKSYDNYQKIGGLKNKKYGKIDFSKKLIKDPFMKWGLDFIVQIKPT